MVNRAWQAIDFRQMPASKLSVPDPPIYRLPHAPRTKKAPRPAVVVDAPVPTTDTSSGGSGAGTGVQAGTVKVPRDDDTATAAKAPNASEADGADNGAEETKGSHRQSELPVMSALAAGYGAPASWRRLEGYSLCDGGPPSQSRRHRSDGDPVFARGNSGDAHAVVLTGRRGDGFWWHPLHWPQHDGRQLLQVRLSRQGRPRNWADPRSHAKAGEGIDGDGDGAGAGAGAGSDASGATSQNSHKPPVPRPPRRRRSRSDARHRYTPARMDAKLMSRVMAAYRFGERWLRAAFESYTQVNCTGHHVSLPKLWQ